MRVDFDLGIDVGDLAVLVDEERRPSCEFPIVDAIRFRRLTAGVAQNWVIQFERLCIFFIGFNGVAAGGEIGNVILIEPRSLGLRNVEFSAAGRGDGELSFNGAGTQRATLLRSATGKCFGEPSYNHWPFAFEIGQ